MATYTLVVLYTDAEQSKLQSTENKSRNNLI